MPATANVVSVVEGWSFLSRRKDFAERGFTVDFDSLAGATEEKAIIADDGAVAIPAVAAAHPRNAALFAKVASAKPKSITLWEVVVEYGPNAGSASVDREPTSSGWLWWATGEVRVEPVDLDAAGTSILNSAGDPFDPPIQMEKSDTVMRGQKLLTEAQRATLGDLQALRNTLNNASVTIDGVSYAQGRCKLKVLDLDPKNVDGTNMRLCTVEVVIRNATTSTNSWKRCIADEGYRDINKVRFMDDDGSEFGVPCSVPRRLDGSGLEKATANAYPLYFVECVEVSWSGLSFA